MPDERCDFLAGRPIPELHGIIVTPCRQQFAVRGEGDLLDRTTVPVHYGNLRACRGIPNPCCPIIAAGGHVLAIRRIGDRGERQLVAAQREVLCDDGRREQQWQSNRQSDRCGNPLEAKREQMHHGLLE